MTESSDREWWLHVAKSLESAAVDLQSGGVKAAGYELSRLAREIRRDVDTVQVRHYL